MTRQRTISDKAMTAKQKNEIKSKIYKLFQGIDETIHENQFEPSERGAGYMTDESTQHYLRKDIEDFMLDILKMFGVNVHMEDKTFDEIMEEINGDNCYDFDELEEIDKKRDADDNDGYVSDYVYLRHTKEDRTLEVWRQEFKGEFISPSENYRVKEVKKKEKIITTYE